MTRRGTHITEIAPAIMIEESASAKGEEKRVFENLQPILAEIRKSNGIIGFILKNSTQAAVDIDNAEELTEFAMLSSQLFESREKLAEVSDVNTLNRVVLESSKIRIMCLCVGGNQLSVFMEKSVDHCRVLKEVISQADE
jgi:hypothetical protein